MASQDSQAFRWHNTEFEDRNFRIRGRTFFFIFVFFSVAIILTLIFIYIRWVYRFRHPFPGAPAIPPALPRGLDAAAINGLPVILHRSSPRTVHIDEAECSICLNVYEDGEKVKILPECYHTYHCECVDRWLTTQSSCPLCRSSLRSDSAADSGDPRTPTESNAS